jgi:hypothetical protein
MMRTEAEVALRTPCSPSQEVRILGSVPKEAERLGRLGSQMPLLRREDAGIEAIVFGAPFAVARARG